MTDYVHVVEIDPYDVAAGAVTTLRYAAGAAVRTDPWDVPANAVIPDCVEEITFRRDLYRETKIGGRSAPAEGTVVLLNTTGAVDELLQAGKYGLGRRAVRIKRAPVGSIWTDYTTVFTGVLQEAAGEGDRVTLSIRDNAWKLEKPLTDYFSSGGAIGKPKPYCGGNPFFCAITPTTTGTVFQADGDSLSAVNAVYDKGSALATPANYSVNLATGVITLTAAPSGLVTAQLYKVSYSDQKPANVLRDIAVLRGGIADPAGLDTAAWTALAALQTCESGIFVSSDEPMTVAEAMDLFCASFGFHWFFTAATGLLTVGRFDAPAATATASISESLLISIDRLPTPPPVWEVLYTQRRYFSRHGEADIALGAVALRNELLLGRLDVFRAADTAIQAAYLDASTLVVDGGMMVSGSGFADNEASRLLALYGVKRDVFRVAVAGRQWAIELNDTVEIVSPRYGLGGGKRFRVIGIQEAVSSGITTLDLWG